MAKKPIAYKLPKTLGKCADALYVTRQERLADQKGVAELSSRETALKEHIIAALPKSEASGIAGKLARVSVIVQPAPQVADWDAFYKHVKKTGHFDLLNKALNSAAVQERWDAGKKVPGVEPFNVVKVSVNKL